jgi:general secretion pathway protein K
VRRQRGFALLVTLWSLGVLSLLTTTLVAHGRGELRLAANLRGAAVAEAAADGAVQEAIFRLVAGQWSPNAAPPAQQIGAATVALQIDNEAGKINPNDVPQPLMVALLRAIGLAAEQSVALAAAIEDFRSNIPVALPHGAKAPAYRAAGLPYGPSGQPYRRLAELRQVLGMTPEIFAALAPHLSVWNPAGIDRSVADPLVAEAYANAGPNGGFEQPRQPDTQGQTLRITARARVEGGGQASRSAVVYIFGPPQNGETPPPYRALEWE